MNRVTKVHKTVQIDLSPYVDDNSGEYLIDNLAKGSKVSITENTNLVTISSDNYSVIDTQAVICLSSVLNKSDLGSVLMMGIITKTPLNILFNNTIPHTNSTLQEYLRISSESKFIDLMKRLIKVGVLYQIKGLIYGQVRVCYMLNPYLSRKRKTFEERVLSVFLKVGVNEKGLIGYAPDLNDEPNDAAE
jgi:hypothetical protein